MILHSGNNPTKDFYLHKISREILNALEELKFLTINKSKPHLNIEEASKYTGLSKHTLYRYCSDNRIPHHKVGRLTYFSLEDLDSFILNKSNKRKSDQELEIEAQTRVILQKNKRE